MVDPVKAFETAAGEFDAWLARAQQKMKSFTGHMESAKVSHTEALNAMAELAVRQEAMRVAAHKMKEHKGLTPDKALEHLKAVDAVLSLAKQGGVVFNEDIFPVEVEDDGKVIHDAKVNPWAAWEQLQASGSEVSCSSCGSEFDMTEEGWFDDAGDAYCTRACVIDYHGEDYFMSVPNPDKWGAEYAVAWPKGTKPIGLSYRQLPMSAFHLGEREERLNNTEGWVNYCTSVGLFLPERTVKTEKILIQKCASCKAVFDCTEVGWKQYGYTRYYCSPQCAVTHYGSSVELTIPNALPPEFNVDPSAWSSLFATKAGVQSWRDWVQSHGYALPEAVRA